MNPYAEKQVLYKLMQYLKQFGTDNSIRIAFPNASFDSKIGEAYISAHVIVLTSTRTTNNSRWLKGTLQLSIWSPRNEGMDPGLLIAGKLVEYFSAETTKLAVEGLPPGVTMTVRTGPEQPHVTPPLQEPHWYHTPVEVPFFTAA